MHRHRMRARSRSTRPAKRSTCCSMARRDRFADPAGGSRAAGRTATQRRALPFLLVGVLLLPVRAHADPRTFATRYSPYEQQAIRDAEESVGAHVEPEPEGKIIERIDFVRLDPIDRHDPLPAGIDVVHTT